MIRQHPAPRFALLRDAAWCAAQVRMRALQESTAELQGRLDAALAEKAAMHRQWLALRRQLAECTARNSRLEADAIPCNRRVRRRRWARLSQAHNSP